jgi:hypothetical protein
MEASFTPTYASSTNHHQNVATNNQDIVKKKLDLGLMVCEVHTNVVLREKKGTLFKAWKANPANNGECPRCAGEAGQGLFQTAMSPQAAPPAPPSPVQVREMAVLVSSFYLHNTSPHGSKPRQPSKRSNSRSSKRSDACTAALTPSLVSRLPPLLPPLMRVLLPSLPLLSAGLLLPSYAVDGVIAECD